MNSSQEGPKISPEQKIFFQRQQSFIQSILQCCHKNDAENLKKLMLSRSNYTLQNLYEMFEEIITRAEQFSQFARWVLQNNFHQLDIELLNLIVVLSQLSTEKQNGQQYEVDETDVCFEVMNSSLSFENSIKQEWVEKNSLYIIQTVKILRPKSIVYLIKLLYLKNKTSDVAALQAIIDWKLSSDDIHDLSSFLMKNQKYKEASQRCQILKGNSKSSHMTQIMKANFLYLSTPESERNNVLSQIEKNINLANKSSSKSQKIFNCIHLSTRFCRQRNFIKSYHYLNQAWKLDKQFPEVCFKLAHVLFDLEEYDQAYEVLSHTKQSRTSTVFIATIYRLMGEIQSKRMHFKEAAQYFNKSHYTFGKGYHQNKIAINNIINNQQDIFVQPKSSKLIYQNYSGKAINDFLELENGKIKKMSKQSLNNAVDSIIQLFAEYYSKTGQKFIDNYIYMTKAFLIAKRYEQAKEPYLQVINIFSKWKKRVKHQFYLDFFLSIKKIPHFLSDRSLFTQTNNIIQDLQQEIALRVQEFMSYGIEFLQQGEYKSSKMAFDQVRKLKGYRQMIDLNRFDCLYVKSCFYDDSLEDCFSYLQKEIKQLEYCSNLHEIIKTYLQDCCNYKAVIFVRKIKINIVKIKQTIQFIKLLLDLSFNKIAQQILEQVAINQQNNQTTSILIEIGYLLYRLQKYHKAFSFLKKGMSMDRTEGSNSFLILTLVKILNIGKFPISQLDLLQNTFPYLKTSKDPQIMTQIGIFLRNNGNIQRCCIIFQSIFYQTKKEENLKMYLECCEKLNKKQQSVLAIKTYIQKIIRMLDYQESYEIENSPKNTTDRYVNFFKNICDYCKKMRDIDPSSQKICLKSGVIQNIYVNYLQKVVYNLFQKDLLISDKYVTDLIQFYKEMDSEKAFYCLFRLIEKYPRYSSFEKLKIYCLNKCLKQQHNPLCPVCTNKLLAITQKQRMSKLYLLTEEQDKNILVTNFHNWFDQVKIELKHNKSLDKKQIIDLGTLLACSIKHRKTNSTILSIYQGMIYSLISKSKALRVYQSYFIEENEQVLSKDDNFLEWFRQIREDVVKMGQENQIFILSFLHFFSIETSQYRKTIFQDQVQKVFGVKVSERLKEGRNMEQYLWMMGG